jgi:hypothetical protein
MNDDTGLGTLPAVALLVALAGCRSPMPLGPMPLHPDPAATATSESPPYEAVVFDPGMVQGIEATWTPQSAQIARLEQRIEDYLTGHTEARAHGIPDRLGDYVCQYAGISDGGRKAIFCNFLTVGVAQVRETTWRNGWVTVDGGGDSFFQLRYDVAAGAFEGLTVNPED